MPAAAGTALDAVLLSVRNGRVLEKREGAWGNHFLPDGGSLIVARGNSRALLEGYGQGDQISITSEWRTDVFGACTNLIQAGPMLIRNGAPITDNETFNRDFTDRRHPRTIVGTDGNRMVWVVIDGRSSVHSMGATMDETRWIARALGLTSAINMDGGGSSQLIWRGITANMPSDGRERPLPYVVMMMPKDAPMTQKRILQEPVGYYDAGTVTYESSGGASYTETYNPYQ